MKKLAPFALLAITIINGCDMPTEQYKVASPAITKGTLIEKNFVSPTNHKVLNVLQNRLVNGQLYDFGVYAKTPEMFIITLENIEVLPNNSKIHYRSYYEVNASTFGELKIGESVDVEKNPTIKIADVW